MISDWRSWFRDKARVDENRRVMALNVSGDPAIYDSPGNKDPL